MKILSFLCNSRAVRNQLDQSRKRLYRVALSWCGDPALADDLVQETLSKALKSCGQLRDPERFDSWLFSIMANCWRDHFRRHQPMEDIDELEDYHCVHEATPEDAHAQSQVVQRVREAVARLPVGQRQVLTLVDLEEFSYAEVAAILDIPAGTVMSRLCRARQALKGMLLDFVPQQSAQTSRIRRVK